MKKIITILAVLMVVAAAAFATAGDQLKLTASVDKIPPQFQIKDGTKSKVGEQTITASSTVETGMDIAEQDIPWTFVINQVGEKDKNDHTKDYAKYNTSVTLTLTLTKFTDGTNTEATDPSITGVTLKTAGTDKLTIAKTEDEKGILLTYSGKVPDQEIGTFSCFWPKDDTLPVGTYTANVTLNYTVQN